ncbi:MAG: hypothetical protein ACFFCV_18735 [Promethearchaeota archaeon]
MDEKLRIKNNNRPWAKISVEDPEELNELLPPFLVEWRKYYPDQLKTHVENISYSKKVSKLEAMKILEKEITDQFNQLVFIYQTFTDPFKIYSFWEIDWKNELLQDSKKELCVSRKGKSDVWTWSTDSLYPCEEINDSNVYLVTGLIFKKDVDWKITLLKNSELNIGLDEKEIVLFPESTIQIIRIEGNDIIREFPIK